MSKSLGGEGKNTNPEELFAAGYSACFQSAMSICAQQLKIDMPKGKEDYYIATDVSLVGDMKNVDLGLRVDMKVYAKGVSDSDMKKLVEKTKNTCPYSRATQGNVAHNIEIVHM